MHRIIKLLLLHHCAKLYSNLFMKSYTVNRICIFLVHLTALLSQKSRFRPSIILMLMCLTLVLSSFNKQCAHMQMQICISSIEQEQPALGTIVFPHCLLIFFCHLSAKNHANVHVILLQFRCEIVSAK